MAVGDITYDFTPILMPLFIIIICGIFISFWVLLFKAVKTGAIHGHKDKLIVLFLFMFTGMIGGVIFLIYRLKKHQVSTD